MADIAIFIGGFDLQVPEYKFENEAPIPHMIEKAVSCFLFHVKSLLELQAAKRVPAKLILSAPPSLGRYREEVQGLFQIFSAIARQAGTPYMTTGYDIVLTEENFPSRFVQPCVWKFPTHHSHCMPACGVSPRLLLSQLDVIGLDFYEYLLRMYRKLGFQAGDLDDVCQLDHEQ